MYDQRVGAAFRAVRIKRTWTQETLARRCGLSASMVSLVERGHLDAVALRTIRKIAAELDIRIELTARTRAGDLERLLQAGHAALHEELARHLDSLPGWVHAPEVSFSIWGERGVIDILAYHPPTGSLLVIELKTDLVSLEELLTTMDVRMRLAGKIARDRGWYANTISAWVVVAESAAGRRRVRTHAATLRSAFPADGRLIRSWLRRPQGTVRALSFWANSNRGGVNQSLATRRRVRQHECRLAAS